MNIPQYVKDMMERSRFVVGGYDPGYTLMINKRTAYTTVRTLEKECERLVAWAIKNGATLSKIERMPIKTHHYYQNAIVTIYDPVMKHLEEYIKGESYV